MPCFFRLVSWMRANDLTMTAQPPRCLGSRAAARQPSTADEGRKKKARALTRVLSARALAVVLVADDNPFEAGGLHSRHTRSRRIGNALAHGAHLVGAADSGHGVERLREAVVHGVDLAVLFVGGADEQVVGDVVEVAAVSGAARMRQTAGRSDTEGTRRGRGRGAGGDWRREGGEEGVGGRREGGGAALEPRSGHADVVGGALALGLENMRRASHRCARARTLMRMAAPVMSLPFHLAKGSSSCSDVTTLSTRRQRRRRARD